METTASFNLSIDAGAPPPRGTQRRTRHRRRVTTTVSSTSSFCRRRRRRRLLLGVLAAGRGTTFGADARGALRRRLRRRTACTARARTQRHRLVAARARAGPTWESERSSSVTRARQGARRTRGARRSMASGEMVGSRSAAPSADARLEPAAAGRRRARMPKKR